MTKELMIGMLQNSAQQLLNTAKAVPEDKLTWRPLDNGRPVLDLLGEAAQMAGLSARIAESRGQEMPSREKFQGMREERAGWDFDHVEQLLNRNLQALIAAIREIPDEELARPITVQLRHEMTMPLAIWIMMANRTFLARFGQINYIQTLYGDFDPH